jgi:hypothetical protein
MRCREVREPGPIKLHAELLRDGSRIGSLKRSVRDDKCETAALVRELIGFMESID